LFNLQTASLLTNWLIKKTSVFQEFGDPEVQYKVGGNILRHIAQLICNAHAITDVLSGKIKSQLKYLSYYRLSKADVRSIDNQLTKIILNAIDIDVQRVSLSTAEESQMRVASAIFPAASMMNHSCDPNIAFGVSYLLLSFNFRCCLCGRSEWS
jgi:hypothetical protein